MNGGGAPGTNSGVANSYLEKERRSTVLPIVKRAEIRRASLNNHQIAEAVHKSKDNCGSVPGAGMASLINDVLNDKPSKDPLSPTPGPVIGVFSKKAQALAAATTTTSAD